MENEPNHPSTATTYLDEDISVKISSTRKHRSGMTRLEICIIVVIILILIALLLPPQHRGRSREAARRTQCRNNLKQIALALFNYEITYHALPPAYTVDAEGNAMHSWRTLILPYLDQTGLYEKIDLSKPWNDPVNADAYNTPVPFFQCPSIAVKDNYTTYLAVVGSNNCFRPNEPRKLSAITTDHDETLMVIEVPAENSVHWMSPSDADERLILGFGPKTKFAHPGGTNAAVVDGRVRFIEATMPASELRAKIGITNER
jgi:type II secretory pathway pseudopilin PulG